MKYVLSSIILLHAAIHSLGFRQAFDLIRVYQFTQSISRTKGIFWLLSMLLFLMTAFFTLFQNDSWWMIGLPAILVSQCLIFSAWHDAKHGTWVNVIVLVAAITNYSAWRFERQYSDEVTSEFVNTVSKPAVLTENDILHMPVAVQRYLHYTRSIGKPKVRSFKARFTGQIREDENSDWMPFTSEQYNFIESSSRLFFMNATMNKLPVAGFHRFNNGEAYMDIRLLSMLQVQYQSGKEMGIAETVTFFNDMCCLAPASLIDKRIRWSESEGDRVKAEFTVNNVTITAWLTINDKGELTNFVSTDRYATDNGIMRKVPWSTPLKDYRDFNGYRLTGYADAIYEYPGKDLCYGKFTVEEIEYNPALREK